MKVQLFHNHQFLEQEDCANLDICDQQVTCLETRGFRNRPPIEVSRRGLETTRFHDLFVFLGIFGRGWLVMVFEIVDASEINGVHDCSESVAKRKDQQ